MAKRVKTSGGLLEHLTIAQLNQLRKNAANDPIDLSVQKEADKRRHYQAWLLRERFNEQFEELTRRYITGCVDDHIGNPTVLIPAENVDSWKQKIQEMAEETVSNVISTLEPFDTREFMYIVKERAIRRASETLAVKVLTIESLPQVAFDVAAKHGNAAVLEEFMSLYRRGLAEALQEVEKEVDGLIKFLEVRNELLTYKKP